ncbi:MAG TPA: DinB family protein [Dehalococcoidia bacterium]|nr:DinB family protein [Dehalococcoidia bacterium]
MTPEEREQLIQRYQSGGTSLNEALQAITRESLDRAPVGEWSARQIIHHVADAEVLRSAQLRILLGGRKVANPSVRPGPRLEHYQRPLEASLDLLRAAIEANLVLLRCLPAGEWVRPDPNGDSGNFSIEEWLRRAANHAHQHAEQVRNLIADA